MTEKASRRRLRRSASTILLLTILIVTLHFGVGATLSAQQQRVFDTGASVQDNLQRYMGERVILRLVSGSELDGTVESVGTDVVHVSQLSGNWANYDALVRIDQIGALIARAR